jgi:hypothetical protein
MALTVRTAGIRRSSMFGTSVCSINLHASPAASLPLLQRSALVPARTAVHGSTGIHTSESCCHCCSRCLQEDMPSLPH